MPVDLVKFYASKDCFTASEVVNTNQTLCVGITITRYISFWLPGLLKFPCNCYSNGPGNLSNLDSNNRNKISTILTSIPRIEQNVLVLTCFIGQYKRIRYSKNAMQLLQTNLLESHKW